MSTVPLLPMDVAGRGRRVQVALADVGCDALLVTHLTNIRYLTGFTGTAGTLVVDEEGLLFVTDARYEERATAQLAAAGVAATIEIGRTLAHQKERITGRLAGAARIGLEADHISWADQRSYAQEWFPGRELVPTNGVIEDLRIVKDAGEVARIEAACGLADQALANVLELLDGEPTETGFARALDGEMRRLGADDVSFPTIVASGPNGSRPHHEPEGRTIRRGELVVIDFGALVEGYHSDMTRTVPVGGVEAIDDTQRRMMSVVTAAQAAGVAAVRGGGLTRDVDEACRAVIEDAGWGDAFVHGTGHGVGLDIHEAPGVNGTSTATLAPGHVVTVEPGVYLPGHGGVRVEDTVVVTANGCRTLTCAPKSHP
ncbi:MAG: M24 family metallopeptidase [Microthrixaceae bacterium]